MPFNPERIIDEPAPSLIAEGRCGRWRRDTTRTQSGKPTRKQSALAEIKAARGAGKSDKALVALARRLCAKGLKDGARCRLTVKERGAPCKKLHGGKTPRGAESANFKRGKYSILRYLNPEQNEVYEAWLNDPARFDHARQGAALEVILANQFARLKAPPLAAWKTVSEGIALLDEAERAGETREADPKKRAAKAREASDLEIRGLLMIRVGLVAFDEESDNADAVKEIRDTVTEQRRVASAEDLRQHRAAEIMTMQQHEAQRAREIEVFWRAIEDKTRSLNPRDQKLVLGALLAAAAAWREEGDLAMAGPKSTMVH